MSVDVCKECGQDLEPIRQNTKWSICMDCGFSYTEVAEYESD